MQAELARAERTKLSQHDVLRQTRHAIALGKRRSLHEDVHRLLERASHQRSSLHAVDAVSRDAHEMASVGHHLDQDGEVAVVDVRAVKLDDAAKLLEEGVAHRLDAEHLNHLDEVVRGGPGEIDVLVVHHLEQVDALGVQHPLGALGEGLRHRVEAQGVRLSDEHLADIRDAAKLEIVEELRLETLEEHLVLRLLLAHVLLELGVHDADAQQQLLGVVVVEDAREIVLEILVDLLRDIRHQQLLIDHHLAVELNPEHPRRHARGVHLLVWHLVIASHKLAILLDHRIRGIRVVVHLGHRSHRVERRVF